MKHRATQIGAVCAVFFLALAATSPSAHAAPKDPFAKPAMKAKASAAKPAPAPALAPKPAPAPAPAPKPTPAPAPMGQASAGSPTPAATADPGPTPEPAPAGGATTSSNPGSRDDAARDDDHDNRRRAQDHSLTSILVPITFFLCILLLVGTIQYMGLRKDRNKHQTLQLMVEKGAQIPVELITPQKRRGSDLRRGLVLVGAGLGLTLFLLMTKDARNSGAFGMGLIPALIGAGYLLAWKLEGRKQGDQPPPTATYTGGANFADTRRDELSANFADTRRDEPDTSETSE